MAPQPDPQIRKKIIILIILIHAPDQEKSVENRSLSNRFAKSIFLSPFAVPFLQ